MWPGRRILILSAALWAAAFPCAISAASKEAGSPRGDWAVLEHVEFLAQRFHDGDDFVVRHQGREYIFRLYFVDAPEASRQVPRRVREQAAAFDVDEAAVLELGAEARDFTARQLLQPFVVTTRWENALGTRSRFYALVTVQGRDLGAELVRHGLARVHGRKTAGPRGDLVPRTQKLLAAALGEAKRQRRGAWAPKWHGTRRR